MIYRALATSLIAVSLSAPALAQEEETSTFNNTLAAGLTLTAGNSETTQANASVVSEGQKEGLGSIRAGIEANYGESRVGDEKDTTVDNARAFINAKKTLSHMTFSYLDASLMRDDIALVDYRATLGPGLGVYLLKSDQTKLHVEVGPSYVWEKVDGVKDDYLAARAGQRFEHSLSDTARVWQSAEYLPEAENFNNYLLNAELGVEAALNARLKLRLVYQYKYDNEPAEGLKKSDRTLIAGISVSL